MKEIHYWVKDREHEQLKKIKGDRTWRAFTLDAAGISHGSIPRGRPPQDEMADLFRFKQADDVPEDNPQSAMNELFEPWKKKKR